MSVTVRAEILQRAIRTLENGQDSNSMSRAAYLVGEVKRLQLEGLTRQAKCALGELLTELKPIVEKVARRFTASARGSLSHDDLVQVGSIAALAIIDRYDPTRERGRSMLEQMVYREAMRECTQHIRLHSSDVHMSDNAARGRTKKTGEATRVLSLDAPSGGGDGAEDGATLYDAFGVEETTTAEHMLIGEQTNVQIKALVHNLPHEQRALVRWVYGIGQPAASIRDVAIQLRVSRAYVAAVLAEARRALKAMLDAEDDT